MKTSLLLCVLPMLVLIGCIEGPRGPQGPVGPSGDDPVDPHIAPRVIWIWLDAPHYYCRWCIENQNDTLPMGYTPGRLLIKFNKIMLSYTVLPNVSMEPKEPGFAYLDKMSGFSIDGQTFEFPIYSYFKVAKSYTFKVGHEATDVTGRKLELDYEKILVPEPYLRIVNSYPASNDTNVYLSSNIYIYFNSILDMNSINKNITITPSTEGTWRSDGYEYGRDLIFVPKNGFKSDTWHEMNFLPGIKDTFGNSLPTITTIKFKTTKFNVTYTYPYNEQQNINVDENITIYFSGYIDSTTVQNAFSISPPISGIFKYYDFSFTFDPIQNFFPNTTYVVNISSSLRSRMGDTLSEPYLFSFKTSS